MVAMATGFITDFIFTILTCLPKLQPLLFSPLPHMFTDVTKVYWLLWSRQSTSRVTTAEVSYVI